MNAHWTEKQLAEYCGKRTEIKKTKSSGIPSQWWVMNKLPIPCAEFRFNPDRKWQFDFYFPGSKIAVEIEGGIWKYGRHNRAKSFIDDMEKYNAAAEMGIRILRYQPGKIDCEQIKKSMGRGK